jgi:hypothetical protein
VTPHTSTNITITQDTELVILIKSTGKLIVHICSSSQSFDMGGKTKSASDATTVDTVLWCGLPQNDKREVRMDYNV